MPEEEPRYHLVWAVHVTWPPNQPEWMCVHDWRSNRLQFFGADSFDQAEARRTLESLLAGRRHYHEYFWYHPLVYRIVREENDHA